MSSVPLFCRYTGTLTIDVKGNSKYVNVVVKSVMINKSITLRELVEKIHRIIKINSNEHQIHLTCNWPLAQERFRVVSIADDDYTSAIIELHPFVNSVEIYVEKEDVSHRIPEKFTRMLDLDNESTGFISPVHNT